MSPSQAVCDDVTGDGNEELICAFEGLGTYIAGFEAKSRPGGRETPKDWQWNRITWAVPDEGHNISCVDLNSNSGKEIFLAYQGRTYYHDYQESAWHTFIHAPFDNIMSGSFTHAGYYDIIASESIGGNLYLYRPRNDKFEVMLYSVYPDAMGSIM